MCLRTTQGFAAMRRMAVACLCAAGLFAVPALGQNPKLDWRRVGNTAVDLALSGVATGPVDRVWYAANGSQFFARTAAGRVFTTTDFENWTEAPGAVAPAVDAVPAAKLPESSAQARRQSPASPKLYAFARFAYRSEDGGATWSNLTGYRNTSLVGDGLLDLAVSPRDPDEIVIGASTGVWRSVDGGRSWTGLNAELPNLQTRRILSVPSGVKGMRVAVDVAGTASAWEWSPGREAILACIGWHRFAAGPGSPAGAWLYSEREHLGACDLRRLRLPRLVGRAALGFGKSGHAPGPRARTTMVRASNGFGWTHGNRGSPWRPWAAPRRTTARANSARVLRTVNGGGFWDDLTADLPAGPYTGSRRTGPPAPFTPARRADCS